MSSSIGMDLNRGRALPAIGTTEAKLQQRKLDALKRGVHRIAEGSNLVSGLHLIGVGGAGVRAVERFLKDAPSNLLDAPGSRLSALAVDIGDADLVGVRELEARFDASKAQIDTVALTLPSREELEDTLAHYVDFLKLEYPLYHPNPDSTGWLPPGSLERDATGSIPRAVAKAAYGKAYYDDNRPMLKILKRFAQSVEATGGDSLICIMFGLGGGTGSGIAMDLARHLSNSLLGRRVLVTGIGIAPHVDELRDSAARLHTTLAELDVLCDETKNRGVTRSCGDLYKNPFTAGFIVVPQAPDVGLADARKLADQNISSLLVQRGGANIWEALRLLNWVAAPSTQHSAARTPWGARWLHLLGFCEEQRSAATTDMRKYLGLLRDYAPEYIELRTSASVDEITAAAWASGLDAALGPEIPTQLVNGAPDGRIQFLLPRMARGDLAISALAKKAYDALPKERRHEMHSLLLEQGLLLCEPSTRLKGMAGANIGSGSQWIEVPMQELNGKYK